MKRLFILALLTTIGITDMWAGYSYYCDVDVKLNSPSSAQGIVYLNTSRKITLQTKPAQTAELRANLEGDKNGYRCFLLAYPKPGYALAGFVSKSDYLAGRTSDAYFLKTYDGRLCRSGINAPVAPVDTASDAKSDPTASYASTSYQFSAKRTAEFYAIFRTARAQTTIVTEKGTLEAAVKRGTYGEDADELTVRGPLNDADFAYLSKLSKEHWLIKIDLSGAKTIEIPDSAFRCCYSLYEITLPSEGLLRIGNNAFEYCYSLKNFLMPRSLRMKGNKIFNGCVSLDFDL